MIRFEIPGKPQGKGRPRVTVRGKYAHAYTPDDTVSYESLIKMCYKQTGAHMIESGAVDLDILALYQIPKSFSSVKRMRALRGDLRPQTKPDLDNVTKIICDALNGIAYHDDAQIVHIIAEKHYGIEPKVIVTITEV